MKGIRIEKGVIIYYGNAAGYLMGDRALVDRMFASRELKDFLDNQNEIRDIRWKEGVFEQLSNGQRDMQDIAILKNCRIWQLKPETDIMMRFISYEELRVRFGDLDLGNYQMVYDGTVESNNLEDIYAKFNLSHPLGYIGHSLSMSDIVEFYDDGGSEFYYCDRIGFQQIEVGEPNQEMEMKL